MLDTIVLMLPARDFVVVDMDAFTPSARGLLLAPYYRMGARGVFKCVQNAGKADRDAGRYMPRLTLTKRHGTNGFSTTLRIEFSAPKLLHGNNFDELTESDFETVLTKLHAAVTRMGIRVTVDKLRHAPISAIHYSKNVALVDFTTCSMVLSELAKINLNARLDLTKTDYRNGGHAIRYHANSFEVVFYDKIKDLEKARTSDKRAIEDDNTMQADLFATPGRFPKQLQVLRMEVRLGTRAKITSVLASSGVKDADLTFAALFRTDTAQKVLLYFWGNVRRELPMLNTGTAKRPEDVFQTLMRDTPTAKPAKLLQHLGALALIQSVGMTGTRALIRDRADARTWQRLKKELDALNLGPNAGYAALKHLDAEIWAFTPLKMQTFATAQTPVSLASAPSESCMP